MDLSYTKTVQFTHQNKTYAITSAVLPSLLVDGLNTIETDNHGQAMPFVIKYLLLSHVVDNNYYFSEDGETVYVGDVEKLLKLIEGCSELEECALSFEPEAFITLRNYRKQLSKRLPPVMQKKMWKEKQLDITFNPISDETFKAAKEGVTC